jgi:integrase/recombinase XerD
MTPQSSTVSELVKAFDGYLSMRRADGTQTKYGQHLRAFEEWAGGRSIDSIEAHEIEFQFLGPWSQGVKSSTLRNRISALRAFYDFCERFDHVERNVMRKIEPPAREDRMGNWLKTDDDVAYQDAVADPAERIIVSLLRHTGLRVSEATALLWSDIDFNAGTLSVRKSKTSAGKRTIPLAPVLIPALRTWQRHLQGQGLYDRHGYVLVTKNRTPMKAQFVWKLTKRVGDRVGLDVSPHTLRRTCGSALINNGARLEVVSKFLGHSSTKITEQSYAELLDATVAAEALEAMG